MKFLNGNIQQPHKWGNDCKVKDVLPRVRTTKIYKLAEAKSMTKTVEYASLSTIGLELILPHSLGMEYDCDNINLFEDIEVV